MGRQPSSGSPPFRFTQNEVSEMEAILREYNLAVPPREVLTSIAEKFSNSTDRVGKIVVQIKQVWNWFQNRRYALKAKLNKASGPAKLSVSTMPREDPTPIKNSTQAMPAHAPCPAPAPSERNLMDNAHMEFEAKSVRDGAWYDVVAFLSHRYFETSDPEVLARFAGFRSGEDEWVNVRKNVRQRSLPCEPSECVVVLPGDPILCFKESKEQALYFDAKVLDAQRWRHDVRGCRCRFLVRYNHDQFEEIVPLRKVCRRPETDYRLQQLHVSSAALDQQKAVTNLLTGSVIKVPSSTEPMHKRHKAVENSSTLPTVPCPSDADNAHNVEGQNAEPSSANNVGTPGVIPSIIELTSAAAQSSVTTGSGSIVPEVSQSPL